MGSKQKRAASWLIAEVVSTIRQKNISTHSNQENHRILYFDCTANVDIGPLDGGSDFMAGPWLTTGTV